VRGYVKLRSDINQAKRTTVKFFASFIMGNMGSFFKGSNALKNTTIADQVIDFSTALIPEVIKTANENN